MTEDEAKTKWCPFARVPLGHESGEVPAGAPSVNRASIRGGIGASGHVAGNSLCIASACMAWRVQVVEQYQDNAWGERPAGEGWELQKGSKPSWWYRTVPRQTVGFCGLAGAPQ